MATTKQTFVLLAVLMLTGCSTVGENMRYPSVLETVHDESGRPVGQVRITRLPELENREIHESSGIASSQRQPGLFWTHNDSGDRPRLFAFDEKGKHLGVFELEGAEAIDWEDMSSVTLKGKPYLLIADVGDNNKRREFCTLYLVEEPVVDFGATPATSRVEVAKRIDFTYDDGRHNCEAVAIDAATGKIYLVTKRGKKACGLYELEDQKPYVARRIATVDIQHITAMDMPQDAERAVLLTYEDAYEFKRMQDESWEEALRAGARHLPMPWRAQGESICYSADGRSFHLTSETAPSPFWKVEIVSEEK